MKILLYPDTILRKKAKSITKVTPKIKRLALNMVKIMQKNKGIGLAAPQIGQLLRLIVVKIPENKSPKKENSPLILINPQIKKTSRETQEIEEGCLSFPNLYGQVKRPAKIKLIAQNLSGKKITISASKLTAQVIQHEIDHLDGIIFIDKIKPGTIKQVLSGKKENQIQPKIIFAGSDNFSLICLKNITKKYLPIALITEPDRPAGRGKKLFPTPIKIWAQKKNLPVFTPYHIADIYKDLVRIEPDVIIVASFGQIISQNILSIPKKGILNIHPSLLPKYRGASPLAYQILAGEKKTGVTIILMDKEIDHGPIIAQKKVNLSSTETQDSLSQKLARLGGKLLTQILPSYLEGRIKPRTQNHTQATFTKKLKKEDGLINWKEESAEIERKIRAYNPWPSAYTFAGGKRLKILKAHLEKGKLRIDQVQPEGKKPMSFLDFLRGHKKLVDFLKNIGYNGPINY